jgi:hypothetical protein
MAGGDGLKSCLEVGEGLDVIDLRGFDERCDAAPGPPAFVMAGDP